MEPPEAQPEHTVPDLRRFHGRSATQGSGARAFPSRPPIAASFALEYRSAPSSVFYLRPFAPREDEDAFPRGSRAHRASFSHRAMPARDVRPKCDRARGAIARAMPSARVFVGRGRSREIIFSVYPRDERPARARERSQNRKLTPRRPPDPPPSLASSGRGVLRAHVGGAQGDDLRDAGARPRVASSRFSQSSPPSRRAGATPSTSVRSRRRPIDSRSDPAPLARPNNRAIR